MDMWRFIKVSTLTCLILGMAKVLFACDTTDDTNFPKSLEASRSSGRLLLLAFLGTDWSISSLKLDREVFDQSEFSDNVRYNYLLCKLHFYQTIDRGAEVPLQNQALAEKYHIEQFPTVIVLAPNGAELGRIGYVAGGLEKFDAAVKAVLPKNPQ
jgi:thioredoxin-related protein